MATSTAVDKQAEYEANFRSSLQDVVTLAEGLSKHCKTVEDLVGMASLAIENDGQLRLIMDIVTTPKKQF